MDLHTFCQNLWGNTLNEQKLAPYWEKLQQHCCADSPDFLTPEFISRYAPLCALPDGYIPELLRVARIVSGNPLLTRWAAMLHYGLFEASPGLPLDSMPDVSENLHEDTGLFQLLIMISSLPLIAGTHQRMNLPEHMLADGASWIGARCGQYELDNGGQPGCSMSGSWMRLHVDGKLFRIGRLEYRLQNYQIELPAVYIEKKTGRPQALCRDGWKFNEAGLRISVCDDVVKYTTAMTFENHCVIGTPVNVLGKVLFDQKLRLDLDEWEPLASAWDIIPSIHIPAGGGMTPEAVKSSLLAARDFFSRCLHLEIKAFGCSSWILNPAWEKELPDSNFASLQRNVYLMVPELAPLSGLSQAYGSNQADPLKEPCRTSLHRAFRHIFERHERLCWGGMIILTRDIDQYGTEYYRRNCL